METDVLVCSFKPTRSRVGRPDARLCDLKLGRTTLRVSSRVPTLQGLMQRKTKPTGPTKPQLYPEFQHGKIQIDRATQLRRFASGDDFHERA